MCTCRGDQHDGSNWFILIPPNPAELLLSHRLEQLISELRQQYDTIFLDCPPTYIVADTSVIAKFADMTVFVIRANVTDKRALCDLETMYKENRFPKLCVIVNDVMPEK